MYMTEKKGADMVAQVMEGREGGREGGRKQQKGARHSDTHL
jgi:hypothetical protein